MGKGFGMVKEGASSLWEHINVGGAAETGGAAITGESMLDADSSLDHAATHAGASDGDRFHPSGATAEATHAGASDGDRFHTQTEATHAGASDGDRFHSGAATEATHAGASDGDRFHPNAEATHAGASDGDRFHSTETPTPETNPHIMDMEIKPGGSVERTIINQLREQGVPKPQAQKLADIWAHAYADRIGVPFEELNHVQPGDSLKLNIDPNNLEGSGIISLERAADNLHVDTPGAHVGGSHSGGFGHAPAGEAIPAAAHPEVSEAAVPGNGSVGVDPSQATTVEGGGVGNAESQAHNMSDGDRLHQTEVDSYQRVYGNGASEIMRNVHAMPESLQSHQGELLNLGGLKAVAEDAYNRALADGNDVSGARGAALESAKSAYESAYAKTFNTIARETFAGQQIEGGVSGLKAMEAAEFLGSENGQSQRIVELKNYVAGRYGENFSNPRSGENMFSWTTRMIKSTLESGGVEYKDYKLLDRGGK
jgi:hypothetical protein